MRKTGFKKFIVDVLLFAVCGIVFFSCKKDTEVTAPDQGYAYFPVTLKKYIIYEVDSIVYDDFKRDTTIYKFQLKEVIDSIITDNQNRPTLRLVRYKKEYNDTIAYARLPWVIKDVWVANRTTTTAEVVEENARLVKLSFPVKKGKTWNGNVYNTNEEWEYKYTATDVALKTGTYSFDSTLTVVQKDYTDLIDRKYYVERYAKNVGLIHREIIDLHSGTIKPSVPVVNRIERGVKCTYTLYSFGYN